MKRSINILSCISALLMSLMMTSCVEGLTAELGEPDNGDCYGVYFPAQKGTGDIHVGPDDPKTFTFQVMIDGVAAGQGSGHSKKEAEQLAARDALQKLENKK